MPGKISIWIPDLFEIPGIVYYTESPASQLLPPAGPACICCRQATVETQNLETSKTGFFPIELTGSDKNLDCLSPCNSFWFPPMI